VELDLLDCHFIILPILHHFGGHQAKALFLSLLVCRWISYANDNIFNLSSFV
jgi:hypothetical protein